MGVGVGESEGMSVEVGKSVEKLADEVSGKKDVDSMGDVEFMTVLVPMLMVNTVDD